MMSIKRNKRRSQPISRCYPVITRRKCRKAWKLSIM